MVTTVVGAGKSNMFGYLDYSTTNLEDDWFDHPHASIMDGKRRSFGHPPRPAFDPEVDLWERWLPSLRFL